MSYAEIAEVVGSSVVAVERQLSRTLKALRLALPEWLSADDLA
jgi:DNA-directed RNA polymerase specialized sigma24 family protein